MEKSRISFDPEVESRCSMRCQRCEKLIKAIDARYGQSHIELDKLHKHIFSTGHPLSGKVFVCSECMASYQSIQKAKKHVRVHHKLSPTARVLSAIESEKVWTEMAHCFPECESVKPDIRLRFVEKLDKMNPTVAYVKPPTKTRRQKESEEPINGDMELSDFYAFNCESPSASVEVESRCSIQCARCEKFIKAVDARYGQNHIELDKLHRHIISAGHPLSGKVFVCSECMMSYQSVVKCRKHVQTSHGESPNARVLSAIESEKVWAEMAFCFPECQSVKVEIRNRFMLRLDKMK